MRKIYISLGCAFLMQLTNSLSAQVFVNEDFGSATGTTPPTGWVNNDIAGNGEMWAFDNPGGRDLNTPITDPAAIFDSDNDGNDGMSEEAALETPAFDASAATGYIYLSFDQYFNSAYGGESYVEVWDGSSWVQVYSSLVSTNDPEHTAIDITSAVNSAASAKVRFKWIGDYSMYWILDNVRIEAVACAPISGLAIDMTTTNSVDISWTSGGSETDWDIEYGPTGFTQGSGMMGSSTSTTFSAGSLTADTYYDFYVRADCGGSQSSWTGPISAYTGYCEVAGTDSYYFINDFSTTGGATNISNLNSGFNGYEDNTSMIVSSFDGGPDVNFSVDFDLGGGTYGFGIWVDWNNDLVFDPTEQMFISGGYNDNFSGSFGVPTGTPVGSYRMRIMGAYYDSAPSDACDLYSNEGEVEDYTFEVIPAPSCLPVSDLAISTQTSSSIDIIWTAGGGETDWDIEYGPEGFTQGTGIMGTANTTPTFSASSLNSDSNYDFYVRANCGGGDYSYWVGPITGRTGYCEVGGTDSYYYINNFHTTGGATSNISNLNSGYSTNGYEDATAMSVSQFAGGPDINFSTNFVGGTYGLGIWVDWNNDLIFDATEQMYVSSTYSNNFSGSFGVPSGIPVGTYRMRVLADFNNSAPTDACTLAFGYGEVEDYTFEVVPTPSCLPVSDIVASNITTTSVDLVWTVNGSEGLWNIEWGPVGFTPGTGTGSDSAQSNDVVYTVNGLNPSTTYDLYIQANCGADSSYWTLVTFTTLCAPASLPWTENFDALQNVDYGSFPNCWVDEGSDWLTDDINQNNTYNTAPYSGNNFLAIGAFFTDDYIWTPEFQLTAGGNYEFSFMWAGAGSSNWDGEGVVSSQQSSAGSVSLGDPFVEASDAFDATYRKVTYCFTPDSSGVYSFAVHAGNSSFFGGGYLTFDDFKLIERTGTAGTDGTMNVCQTGGLVELNDIIVKDDQSGYWSFNPNPNTIVNDSLFNPQYVPAGTVYVNYITTGCLIDTATAIVTIYGPSMAGDDGAITACKNQPLDLLSGLNGTVTTGGDWYDPTTTQLPSSQITTGNFIGSFNYNYITGNGVCPDDTSLVVVTVTNCNWLAVGENEMEGVNVYPNPSTGLVYIESTFSTGSYNLVITDVNGRIVDNKNNTIVAGTNAIHLENVERGVYFFKLSNNTAEKVYRVVIE